MSYNPKIIEQKWQEVWDEANLFNSEIDMSLPKYYCLEMYPYPSGKMHMGHVRNYSIGDSVARYKRSQGYNVIYPMGFDSFGMPAENAAISEGEHPRDITERNIASITADFKRMGFSHDWRKEVRSHDSSYYHWNQWAFLKFLENGLAYRKHAAVNWCSNCATVLANEQVHNGRCWRCSDEVIQKDMEQWFLRITDYAQELLDSLDDIEFPDNVAILQKDWIGRSEGALIRFSIKGDDKVIEAFTTRPDTIFGVTFVTLAPEHILCEQLVSGTEYEKEWRKLLAEVLRMSDLERGMLKQKKGVFLGRYAINPMNGEDVPIYAGNFVIASYGTGAVMAVPGHDQRDFDFAVEYGIAIRRVLLENVNDNPNIEMNSAFEGYGSMINSNLDGFDGLAGDEAMQAVIVALESDGKGHGMVQWKIRDWLISRQRYWGTPIPIIHCLDCGVVPVPESDLPIKLPDDVEFTEAGNPLSTSDSFVNAKCPKCSKMARRETDTMDTFVDSSWYFMRYTDSNNSIRCFDAEKINYWMNVDFYCGGIEHAQMHLIYARFWTKALRDLGIHGYDEPFQKLLCQGMVNAQTPWCENCGIDHNVEYRNKPCPHCGGSLKERSAKMSKSLGNTVSPRSIVDNYSADTVRLFILFAAQPTAGMDWSDDGINAAWRQLNHLSSIPKTVINWDNKESDIDEWFCATMRKRVGEWIEAMDCFDLRKAVEISHYDIVKDLNWYQRRGGRNSKMVHRLLSDWAIILHPSTPHLAEEWWYVLDNEGFVVEQRIDEQTWKKQPNDTLVLGAENYLRMFLVEARGVLKVALRHLEGPANGATALITQTWKTDLAISGIRFQQDGGNLKQFSKVMETKPYTQESEQRVEVIQLWRKRMLPQIFKWSPEEKDLLLNGIDEEVILKSASNFIASELEIQHFNVELADDNIEHPKSKYAFPLKPGLMFV